VALRIEQPWVLQPCGGGGGSRKLQQVVTVACTVAGQDISELDEVPEDLLAAVSDTADETGKTLATGGGGSNNVSYTLNH